MHKLLEQVFLIVTNIKNDVVKKNQLKSIYEKLQVN